MHLQIRRIEVFCTFEQFLYFTCTMIPMACLLCAIRDEICVNKKNKQQQKINQMEENSI